MFLLFNPSQRMGIARSSLVQDHKLVVQDRAFCYGPAVFCKVLYDLQLSGTVLMTHVTTPRATAYFAALLSQNDKVYSLLAFGAGDNKCEFESYMSKLQVDNVLIYSKRLLDMDLSAEIFENVVAVFATPPNSYTAVNDPVDLVCGRGGDLLMLELLTNTDSHEDGRRRVHAILEEQRKTLLVGMSRPQVQFVLYETHSRLSSENDDMVRQALTEINHVARYKHAEAKGKFVKIPGYLAGLVKPPNSATSLSVSLL